MHLARNAFALFPVVLALVGCDESDLVSIRIRLNKDYSGTLVTSGLMIPAEPSALERASHGVAWRDRLQVIGASGAFDNVAKLSIEDIVFSCGGGSDGPSYVTINVPRGPQARWVRALAPLSLDERKRATEIFDPTGKVKELGSLVKLQIDFPGPVIAHGVSPSPTGCKEEAEEARATLVVSVETALSQGGVLVWQLTWR